MMGDRKTVFFLGLDLQLIEQLLVVVQEPSYGIQYGGADQRTVGLSVINAFGRLRLHLYLELFLRHHEHFPSFATSPSLQDGVWIGNVVLDEPIPPFFCQNVLAYQ